MKRTSLTQNTPVTDLRDFYWLKKELQDFCRAHGLSPSGEKLTILKRIEHFLKTGERTKSGPSNPKIRLESFSLTAQVPVGFQCSRNARDFFISQVGTQFRFTVELQKYIKENPDITFQDIINEWKAQLERKRTGRTTTEIGVQFEYNRFTRDFFSDPDNEGKTRKDCIEAWKKTRTLKGDRKYRSTIKKDCHSK